MEVGDSSMHDRGRPQLPKGKAKERKLESYVTQWLYSEIEKEAEKRGMSRAGVVRELLMERFDKRSETRIPDGLTGVN